MGAGIKELSEILRRKSALLFIVRYFSIVSVLQFVVASFYAFENFYIDPPFFFAVFISLTSISTLYFVAEFKRNSDALAVLLSGGRR